MPAERKTPSTATWRSVVQRDREADADFVYVALTTGIYCRPSCPARLPQRRDVIVFPTADEAARHGYSACRRCHSAAGSLAPAEKSIKAALEYIEAHLECAITLRALSRIAGLSQNHLQETFTRIVGLSPKTFCSYRRLARLKEHLRNGESVANAAYASGYGSMRSLYERAYKALGMTPATYRRGAPGERIGYVTSSVTLGRVLVARTERGVCGVLLGDEDDALLADVTREFSRAVLVREDASHAGSMAAILHHDQEDPLLSKLHFQIRRDVFQAKLWHALS